MIAAAIFYGLIAAAWLCFAAASGFGRSRLPGARIGPAPAVPVAALAGLACWGLSYLFNTAWTFVPPELRVSAWQFGLFAICCLYVVTKVRLLNDVDAMDRGDVALGLLALLLIAVARLGADRDYIDTALIALIVVLCWRCYDALDPHDLFGRLAWAVLGVAETAQLPLFVVCRAFDPGPDPLRLPKEQYRYACDRAFEAPLITHAPTIVTGAALLWIVFRWFNPRQPDGRPFPPT